MKDFDKKLEEAMDNCADLQSLKPLKTLFESEMTEIIGEMEEKEGQTGGLRFERDQFRRKLLAKLKERVK